MYFIGRQREFKREKLESLRQTRSQRLYQHQEKERDRLVLGAIKAFFAGSPPSDTWFVESEGLFLRGYLDSQFPRLDPTDFTAKSLVWIRPDDVDAVLTHLSGLMSQPGAITEWLITRRIVVERLKCSGFVFEDKISYFIANPRHKLFFDNQRVYRDRVQDEWVSESLLRLRAVDNEAYPYVMAAMKKFLVNGEPLPRHQSLGFFTFEVWMMTDGLTRKLASSKWLRIKYYRHLETMKTMDQLGGFLSERLAAEDDPQKHDEKFCFRLSLTTKDIWRYVRSLW